jgi:hypothetical protein
MGGMDTFSDKAPQKGLFEEIVGGSVKSVRSVHNVDFEEGGSARRLAVQAELDTASAISHLKKIVEVSS